MEFFKKKSLLAMAAMFAASALFVGCGGGGGGGEEDPNPDTGGSGFNPSAPNVVLLDDFEMRVIDDETGEEDFTNQNALAKRGISNAGSWYGYANNGDGLWGASAVQGVIEAFPEGAAVRINATNDASTTEQGMKQTLGSGRMIAALDVLDAANAGDGYYYATIETPFFEGSGNTKVKANLSGLKSVRIKGKIMGKLNVNITNSELTDAEQNWSQWGWKIGNVHSGTWQDINVDLQVSNMNGTDGGNPATNKAETLSRAETLSFELDTEGGTRVDLDIEEVYLIFNSESDIPAEFNP